MPSDFVDGEFVCVCVCVRWGGGNIFGVRLLLQVICQGDYEEWCLMWSFINNMLLRLFVNRCVSNWMVCMIFMVINIALTFTRRMFWQSGNLCDIWVLSLGMNTLDPTMVPFIRHYEFLVGGMKAMTLYMHCCG